MPAAQVDAIVAELDRLDRLARARGSKFVFVIAPNKTTVYPEYLPAGLTPIGPTPADQLMRALAARPEIPVLDGRPLLARSKNLGPLYYRMDTHWNDLGAFIVLNRALMHAGVPAGRLKPTGDYRIERGTRKADLLMFLNIGVDTEYDVPTLVERVQVPGRDWQHYGGDAIVSDILTRPAPATGNVLVIGDSFSASWLPVLSDNFGRVVRVIQPTLRHDDLIRANNPDIILLERVERGIRIWWPVRS
jgi:alginate O-acetyltransferase complex protein AlgJ